jgi:septal ring factor EnvC (AmiA/AmiB activator)
MKVRREVWVCAALVLAGCAVPATRGDEAPQTLTEERDAQAEVQAETAKLQAEIAALKTRVMERERNNADLRREYSKLAQRIDRLLELQQRTYQAVAEKPAAPVEYRALPAPSDRQLEVRAMIRAIDRLDLNPEQKRALIQMLRTPRELDGSNPWDGQAEWH